MKRLSAVVFTTLAGTILIPSPTLAISPPSLKVKQKGGEAKLLDSAKEGKVIYLHRPPPVKPRQGFGGLQYDERTPFFLVKIHPKVRLDDDKQEELGTIADALSGSKFVPPSRLDYYSALIKSGSPDLAITGWQGVITNARDVPGGVLVTVHVIPSFVSVTGIDSDYFEQYFVSEDLKYQYRGSADPKGRAGKMPSVVRF